MEVFNSKVLLFGEYSLIINSKGLACPFDLFDGSLIFSKQKQLIKSEFKALIMYLKDLKKNKILNFDFDIRAFEVDVDQGLIFDSCIPKGYGLGSSGALCAALYRRYVTRDLTQRLKNLKQININQLKNDLSQLESFFHGSSSGIDPLVSYLNKSIIINDSSNIEILTMPQFTKQNGTLFLLNTGMSRKTEPLVNLFLEKMKDRFFANQCKIKLLTITNDCINTLLDLDINKFSKSFFELSTFQYEFFSPMIPSVLKPIWLDGLEKKAPFQLKLCGAGGGGFLMGFTSSFESSAKYLSDFETRRLLEV